MASVAAALAAANAAMTGRGEITAEIIAELNNFDVLSLWIHSHIVLVHTTSCPSFSVRGEVTFEESTSVQELAAALRNLGAQSDFFHFVVTESIHVHLSENLSVTSDVSPNSAYALVSKLGRILASARQFDSLAMTSLHGHLVDVIESEALHPTGLSWVSDVYRSSLNDIGYLFEFHQQSSLDFQDWLLVQAASSSDVVSESAQNVLAFQNMCTTINTIGLHGVVFTSASAQKCATAMIAAYQSKSFAGIYDTPCLARFMHWEICTTAVATFSKQRISELFDIIVEYPESQPAVCDLREAICPPVQEEQLLASLATALKCRLLHPGASTSSILSQYALVISTLRELDQTGMLGELACRPIRSYLQSRQDTARCIVECLLDDSGSINLCDVTDSGGDSDVSGDENDEGDEWVPDPTYVTGSGSRSQRTGDIASALMNVCDSRSTLVREYQSLLRERLLKLDNYDDVHTEARNLELLKLRFGEDSMSHCDVMIKDVADSKRIGKLIQEEIAAQANEFNANGFTLRVMVLSKFFWPKFKSKESFLLPKQLQHAFAYFQDRFKILKASRTVDLVPQLGSVTLELKLEGSTVEYTVSPVVATVLLQFEEKSSWAVAELEEAMEVERSTLKGALEHWIRTGLIRADTEFDGRYVLDESGHLSTKQQSELLEVSADASSTQEDAMEVYWQFTEGMLRHASSPLPCETIFRQLSMFMEDCDISPETLRQFLLAKADVGHLLVSNNNFALPQV